MTKRIAAAALGIVLALSLAAPVLAAYYADIDVTESNGTTYEMLALNVTMDIDYLATEGFIDADGLDVRIRDSQGSLKPFLLTDSGILFASALSANKVTTFRLTTDNTRASSFSIVLGDGGYCTTSDAAALEPGDDFEIDLDGYFNTDTATDYVTKGDYFGIWTDGDGYINAEMPNYIYFEGYKASGIDWQQGSISNNGATGESATTQWAWGDRPSGGPTGEGNRVTDVAINLTGIDTIYIDWGASESGDVSGSTGFIASTVQMGGSGTYDARITDGTERSREIDQLDVSSLNGNYYLRFYGRASSGDGKVTCSVFGVWFVDSQGYCSPGGGPKVSAALATGDHQVTVWADGSQMGLDIDGSTEDTEAFDGDYAWAYVPDKADNWILTPDAYFDYYQHSVSDTLIAWYEPIDIISGTTLPDRQGTAQDGAITWGSNPAGVTYDVSSLLLDTAYQFEEISPERQDIIAPEPGVLTAPINLEALDDNPMHPLVETITSTTDLPESTVWIFGSILILAVGCIFVFFISRENVVFTAVTGLGISTAFYLGHIFPLWVIVLFAFGAIAAIVHERMPTW